MRLKRLMNYIKTLLMIVPLFYRCVCHDCDILMIIVDKFFKK